MSKQAFIIIGAPLSGGHDVEKLIYEMFNKKHTAGESIDILHSSNSKVSTLNAFIFSKCEAKWHDPIAINSRIHQHITLPAIVEEVDETLSSIASDNELLVIHDPRISFYPLQFTTRLEAKGYEVMVLITIAQPEVLYKQYIKAYNIQNDRSNLIYLQYYSAAEQQTRNLNRAIVDISEFETKQSLAKAINEHFNLEINTKQIKDLIDGNFDPSYFSQQKSSDSTANKLYTFLNQLSKKGNTNKELLASLDSTLSELNEWNACLVGYLNISNQEINSKKSYSQLYIDSGSGFSEQNSFKKEISATKQNVIDYDLMHVKGVEKLRFDPLNSSCVLENIKISAILKSGRSIPLKYHTNEDFLIKQYIIFASEDPRIFVSLDQIDELIIKIKIEVDYVSTGKNNVENFLEILRSTELIQNELEVTKAANNNNFNKIYALKNTIEENTGLVLEKQSNIAIQLKSQSIKITTEVADMLALKLNKLVDTSHSINELIKEQQLTIHSLDEQLKKAESQLKEEGISKAIMKKQCSQLQDMVANYEETIIEKKKKCQNLQKMAISLETKAQQIPELNKRIQHLQNDIHTLKSIIQERELAISSLQQSLSDKNKQIDSIKHEVHTIEKRNHEIIESKSYKVGFNLTKPLRYLKEASKQKVLKPALSSNKVQVDSAILHDISIPAVPAQQIFQSSEPEPKTSGFKYNIDGTYHNHTYITVWGWAFNFDGEIDVKLKFLSEEYPCELGYLRADVGNTFNLDQAKYSGFMFKLDKSVFDDELSGHSIVLKYNDEILEIPISYQQAEHDELYRVLDNQHIYNIHKYRQDEEVKNWNHLPKLARKYLFLIHFENENLNNLERTISSINQLHSSTARIIIYGNNTTNINLEKEWINIEVYDIESIQSVKWTGYDYISIIECGDIYAKNYISAVEKELVNHPKCQIIYTDHDELQQDGNRQNPWYKPNFNLQYYLSYDYIGLQLCIKASVFKKYFKKENDIKSTVFNSLVSAVDYETTIRRLPQVLSSQVVQHQVSHAKQIEVNLDKSTILGRKSPTIPLEEFYDLSIIILNKDCPDYIIPLLESLKTNKSKSRYEVIIGDTGSKDKKVLKYYSSLKKLSNFTVVNDLDYHFSKNYNELVYNYAKGKIIGCLNNDIVLENSDFIDIVVDKFTAEPTIGVIGFNLLYENLSSQHAGIKFFHKGEHRSLPYHRFHRQAVPKNLANEEYLDAVTGAFLFCEKSDYVNINGFDEEYNKECQDVDLCLNIKKLGKNILFINGPKIIHIENGTRPKGDMDATDRSYFLWKWKTFIDTTILENEQGL